MTAPTETHTLAERLTEAPTTCACEGVPASDEDGCCVSCGLDHRAFETPSLTTEQARDYAQRWAWWHQHDAPGQAWETETPPHAELTPSERGELFAWVRARCKLNRGGAINTTEFASDLADCLWSTYDGSRDDEAVALLRASGWPS